MRFVFTRFCLISMSLTRKRMRMIASGDIFRTEGKTSRLDRIYLVDAVSYTLDEKAKVYVPSSKYWPWLWWNGSKTLGVPMMLLALYHLKAGSKNLAREGLASRQPKRRFTYQTSFSNLPQITVSEDKPIEDCGGVHAVAVSTSFFRSAYDTTKFFNLIPEASFVRKMSILFKNSIIFVFLRSWFVTIIVHILMESSYRLISGKDMR